MVTSEKREFLRELDHIAEDFVREKLALGGFPGDEVEVVKYWLSKRDQERADQRAREQAAMTRGTAWWTRATGLVGLGVTLGVAVLHWLASKGP